MSENNEQGNLYNGGSDLVCPNFLIDNNAIIIDLKIESEFHKMMIGKKEETVKNFSTKYGVKIHVPEQGEVNADIIRVVGSRENTEKAKTAILEMVEEHAKLVSKFAPKGYQKSQGNNELVWKDDGDHWKIDQPDTDIARKFPSYFNTETHTDCGVFSHKTKHLQSCVSNSTEQREGDIDSNGLERSALADSKILPPKNIVMKEQCSFFDAPLHEECSKIWPDFSIATRKQRITNRIKTRKNRRNIDNELKTIIVNVESEFHAMIIGRKGEKEKKLRKKYRVKILVPQAGDTISVVGSEENAEKAKNAILKMIDERINGYKGQMFIDSRIYSRIIGVDGRNILNIMDEYNVHIKYSQPVSDIFELIVLNEKEDGNQQNVVNCMNYLEELKEEYMHDLSGNEALAKPAKIAFPRIPRVPEFDDQESGRIENNQME